MIVDIKLLLLLLEFTSCICKIFLVGIKDFTVWCKFHVLILKILIICRIDALHRQTVGNSNTAAVINAVQHPVFLYTSKGYFCTEQCTFMSTTWLKSTQDIHERAFAWPQFTDKHSSSFDKCYFFLYGLTFFACVVILRDWFGDLDKKREQQRKIVLYNLL